MKEHGEGRCVKLKHDPGVSGYLHGDDDDGPYDVDGLAYCGRCHGYIDPSQEAGLLSPSEEDGGMALFRFKGSTLGGKCFRQAEVAVNAVFLQGFLAGFASAQGRAYNHDEDEG